MPDVTVHLSCLWQVRWRLFREACLPWEGNYVKDLSFLGRNLCDTIIVDNSPHSYVFQPENALPISTFIGAYAWPGWGRDKSTRASLRKHGAHNHAAVQTMPVPRCFYRCVHFVRGTIHTPTGAAKTGLQGRGG